MTNWYQAKTVLFVALMATTGIAEEPAKTDGSDIGISIMGSIVQKAAEDNVALIKESGGTVKAVKRDHVIMDKYKVVSVHAEYVEVVTRDAKRILIYQDKFADQAGPKPASDAAPAIVGVAENYHEDGFERRKDKITMTAMYRDKLVKEDLAKVLMQATAEPYLENGAIIGFKLSQIDEGSIFQKAGLADEDIVTGINGQELSSVAGAISLLKNLKGVDQIDVEIRRGGQNLKYNISVN